MPTTDHAMTIQHTANTVIDNTRSSRFELEEAGHIAFADYFRRNGVLVIPHVEAPTALQIGRASCRERVCLAV